MGVLSFILGIVAFIALKFFTGWFWFTVKPDERAVLTSFGKAETLKGGSTTNEATASDLSDEEQKRYDFPALIVKGPGFHKKWPWQKVHKVTVSTQSVDLVWDPTKSQSTIEAVTKDNLTTGVNGQLRFRVSERNLYPYFFGVESPLQHVMGYFISVMRERIANFVDPRGQSLVEGSEVEGEGNAVELSEGVSINDLRKNLPLLNQYMEEQSRVTVGRYGIELDAALITSIDPPGEVDRALSAINSTRNQVAADISTARADSEQQITMSKRAVEIANNNAEAEVAPLKELASTLSAIKQNGGSPALAAYLRNMKVKLYERARRVVQVAS